MKWDQRSYWIDEERKFLISGEVHYFRVPKSDWEQRLLLLKKAGGNCVATYIPWILHEPKEGEIRFGNVPERDLESFLQLCGKLGLMVLCRPGPYQYSELKYDGLPGWLCENYPQLLARDQEGKIFRGSSVSYLHPLFLEKTQKWFDAVCPIIAKYTRSKGGPVVMVQVDNELMGIHEWFGGWDYNAETMGFGLDGGRYPMFLKRRYGRIENLNEAYHATYETFKQVHPKDLNLLAGKKVGEKDYQNFYFEQIAEYVEILSQWMRSHGIDCQIVHNSGNPNMNAYFLETVQRLKNGFLLGSDHYYNLDQDWKQNNPTPQYAIHVFCSYEKLRLMGYPPTAFEIPGGSFSDWPPILPEDLMCCYLLNVALGMKGINYYIFTGGPNPKGVSHFGNIYDYGAPVSAFGEIRPTYQTTRAFGKFLEKNSWLAEAERVNDFYIGLDWEQSRSKYYDTGTSDTEFSDTTAWEFVKKGLLTTAFCGSLSANFIELDALDTMEPKPLLVASSSRMPEKIQQSLVQFVKSGGKLLLAPVIPYMDENFQPCIVLKDFLKVGKSRLYGKTSPVIQVGPVDNILVNGTLWVNDSRPEDAVTIARETDDNREIGWKKTFSHGGEVIWLGFHWKHSKFEHTNMLRYLLKELGCETPVVQCSNPHVFTSLRAVGNRYMLFLMNLLSSKLNTQVQVKIKGKGQLTEENIELAPMEVKTLSFII